MKFLLIASAVAALAIAPAVAQTAQQAPVAGKRALKVETRADAQARAQRLFAQLDTNRDGFVTQAESDAIQARRAAKRAERGARQAQRRDPAQIFARLDANGDGQITRAEAEAARVARVARKGGQPAQAHAVADGRLFERADSNRDGAITRAEFAAMPRRQNPGGLMALKNRAAGRMFSTGDANKDGRVSLAEVQQLTLQRFDRLDLNRDGTLTPEERKQARQQLRAQRRPS
jgi:Ca2+-binding EF-hand superfamily protein